MAESERRLTTPCRWHRDKDVPGGRFLVPGCWNRAVYGDDAECHCRVRLAGYTPPDVEAKMDALIARVEKLERKLAGRA